MINYKYESKDNFSEAITELYHILKMLRSKNGCPWDKKQTCNTVVKSLIEEFYEYIDALKKNDKENEAEEIGDILLNVLMIIQIHEDHEDFTAVKAINSLCEKLVRRHPHVFTDQIKANDAEDVKRIWDEVKINIEGHSIKDGPFNKINKSAPLLLQSVEIQKVMKKYHYDWTEEAPIYDKVIEELNEVKESQSFNEKEAEIGDLLFIAINLARFNKIDPNIALHRTNEKIIKRFSNAIKISKDSEDPKEIDKAWEKAKKLEK